MEVLITSALSVLLAEMGDRTQILAAVLAIRYASNLKIILGLAAATLVNCALSAFGGSMIDQWVSSDAVTMMIALAYIFAGAGMLMWRRPVDTLENWKLGGFWTALIGLGILQFGDKSQFIVAVQAARTAYWPFAALGGFVGIMAACIPAILLRDRLAKLMPLHPIRYAAGAIFLCTGLYWGLRAKGLIG
jgi:Ca2+/H+ antiporter, TMEM165/GDT1 family